MKTILKYSLTALTGISLLACEKQDAFRQVSQDDLSVASQMIGETLSDDREGLVASLADATANLSTGGISFSKHRQNPGMGHPTEGRGGFNGRGAERNVQISYDSLTGTHTVTFERSMSNGNMSKSVTFTNKYIYRDVNGEFVRYPRQTGFASVEFDGIRSGSMSGGPRSSSFERRGTFTLTGADSASTTLSYDGEFSGNGNHVMTARNGDEMSRSMTFRYQLTNIKIEKSALTLDEPFSEGVTGTIEYNVTVVKNRNGEIETEELVGTVELTGDGTALLRYAGHSARFLVRLGTGEVEQAS